MCKMYYLILYLTLTTSSFIVQSARILAVFPTPSLSHQVVFNALIKGLAKNGHHITLVTTDPLETKTDYQNVTQINLRHTSYKLFWENIHVKSVGFSSNGDVTAIISQYYHAMRHVIDSQFQSPEVKKLIQHPIAHKFDLFIGQYMTSDVFAFADLYRIPSIGINSMLTLQLQFEMVGNPVHPFHFSHALSTNIGFDISFYEKILSLYYVLKADYRMYYEHFPQMDNSVKTHFGLRIAKVRQCMANINILFINSNSVFSGSRPNVPSVVFLGNMHFKDELPLPDDLQSYLDASKNGVVYMSLGSNIQSNKLPEDRRRVFVETFRDLPYNILWKWEDENLPDRPDNVRVSKWLPQNDVLRHPNVKLFITQSGLQSTEEAIKNKVPMIGIPFITDQFFNSKRLEHFQVGLQLHIMTLTKEQLRAAVILIMENTTYTENIAKLSRLMHDQPMKPIERAVWWTEYVVRHQGAPHLRSPLLHVSFFEYYMLDVLSVLLAGLLTALVTVYYIVKLSLRRAIALLSGDKMKKVN